MSTPLRRLALPLFAVLMVHLTWVAARGAVEEERDAGQHHPGGPGGPLMAAAGGPIEDLAIQFHRLGGEVFLEVYEHLFRALDPATTVHVVVSDEADRARFEEARLAWLEEAGRGPTVRYLLVGRPITSWARDRFAVLGGEAEERPTILAPPAPMTGPEGRANDFIVPWAMHAHLDGRADLTVARFRFEGGDLIADDEHVFVATPLFERNPERTPERLLALIEQDVSRPVIRLGGDTVPAPSHHIGMFVTPLGDGVVGYADPELGRALVDGADEITVGGAPLRLDPREGTHASFRGVGRTLRARGLETFALPALVSSQAHVWISYNNVLMERRRDGRLHVYMPTYDLPALDRRATEIYERRGAVVHPIPVQMLFRHGGTVRCLTAPLRRG